MRRTTLGSKVAWWGDRLLKVPQYVQAAVHRNVGMIDKIRG
jgi:hypothetical protein